MVYPPVDTDFFHPHGDQAGSHDPYALVVSALVPYKRIDLAIDAARLAGIPLRIVGTGPERARSEQHASAAGADVRFLGRLSNDEVRELYRGAALVLLTGEEDFGIVPLEAQACGRPVVALGRGGALETVVPDETGVLVDEPTADAFADAITRALGRRFDPARIRRHAERFSRSRFGDQIEALVSETWRARGPRVRGHQSMVRRYNRLLVAFHVLSDALLGLSAFIVAYALRFHSGLIPITKGVRRCGSTST